MTSLIVKGKRLIALINLGADKSYINWKLAQEICLQIKEKENPYLLVEIEGKRTSYNKGIVTCETREIKVQIQGKYIRENFDITNIRKHNAILRRR